MARDFGFSVSVSADGNTAVVGAVGQDSDTHAGAAYLFGRSGTTWTQRQQLSANDPAINDQFGNAVSVSADGSTALISAYTKNFDTGAAYLFTSGGTTWSLRQKLTANDAKTISSAARWL